MKKKICALLLVFSVVFTMLSMVEFDVFADSYSGSCGANMNWRFQYGTLGTGDTLVISGSGEMDNYTNVNYVPWHGFKERVKRIIISDTVTSISDYAFRYFVNLESFNLPQNLTSIGDYAFSGCYNISTTNLSLPNGLTKIGTYAFNSWSGIKNLYIPDSVTSIGSSAFSGCSSLTSITVGADNTKYYSENNCLIEKDTKKLVLGCQNSIIPNDVTSIDDSAFSGCSSLTSVTIPDSVTSIGSGAFCSCSSLISITIPDSVTSIGSSAFYGCSDLNYNTYDNAQYLGNSNNPYVVLVKASSTSITSCNINANTKFIHSCAFQGCSSLISVTIPDSVISIETCAFDGCNSLNYNIYDNAQYLGNSNNPYIVLVKATSTSITSCNINANTKFIYYSAFYNCSSLTNITIPDRVTSIGDCAFYSCSSLTNIEIPDEVKRIGLQAFQGCSNLTSIEIPDKVTSIGGYAFCGCSKLAKITIPNSIRLPPAPRFKM